MDKAEAMILEIEKNHVLHNKTDKDYKDIILQDENVGLVLGGGTLQIHFFSVKFCALTRLFLFLCCFGYKYSTMIFSVFDSTCAMIPNDQILSLTARKRRAASKAVDNFPHSGS